MCVHHVFLCRVEHFLCVVGVGAECGCRVVCGVAILLLLYEEVSCYIVHACTCITDMWMCM